MTTNDPTRAVWITGVGLATPLGNDLATLERNLLEGRSGVVAVTSFPAGDHPSRVAAPVESIPRPPSQSPDRFDQLPRIERAALWSIESALREAGRWDDRHKLRVGLVLGLGAEWMELWEVDRLAGGDRVLDPSQDEQSTLDRVRDALQLSGPGVTVSAACAASNFAFEIGRNWIRRGLADICVVGGCEMAVTPVGLATFGNLRALSRRNDEPARASRPFDRRRDGFVLGEGGVFCVLELSTAARRRGANAYAEVAGFGAGGDAHHHVIPSPDPAPAAGAIRRALRDARVEPRDVDHINAHATGTPVGDACEAAVLRLVFGEALDAIPTTSTKSMTGHLLTAAGAIEALACVAAMRRGAIPPTINLDEPDVELFLAAHEAMPRRVSTVVSNSFGFGGANSCLVLRSV